MLSQALFLSLVAVTTANVFQSTAVALPDNMSPLDGEVLIRGKRQCGGMGGCCAGSCSCGGMGQCGQTCCPAPAPCSCGQPGCAQCVTNTVLVPVQQTTCCQCCKPVCTQACINGGGCGCGCTRGGCGRKRRSLLALESEQMTKDGEHMV